MLNSNKYVMAVLYCVYAHAVNQAILRIGCYSYPNHFINILSLAFVRKLYAVKVVRCESFHFCIRKLLKHLDITQNMRTKINKNSRKLCCRTETVRFPVIYPTS